MGRGGAAAADDPEDNPADKKPIIPLDEGASGTSLHVLPLAGSETAPRECRSSTQSHHLLEETMLTHCECVNLQMT